MDLHYSSILSQIMVKTKSFHMLISIVHCKVHWFQDHNLVQSYHRIMMDLRPHYHKIYNCQNKCYSKKNPSYHNLLQHQYQFIHYHRLINKLMSKEYLLSKDRIVKVIQLFHLYFCMQSWLV